MFRSVKPLFFSHPQWVLQLHVFPPCATQFTAVQGVTGMTWLLLEQIVQVSDFLAIWWGSRHVGPTRFLQQKKCQPFGKWVASVEVTAASSNLGERKAGKKCCSSNSSCGGRRRFKTLRTPEHVFNILPIWYNLIATANYIHLYTVHPREAK